MFSDDKEKEEEKRGLFLIMSVMFRIIVRVLDGIKDFHAMCVLRTKNARTASHYSRSLMCNALFFMTGAR